MKVQRSSSGGVPRLSYDYEPRYTSRSIIGAVYTLCVIITYTKQWAGIKGTFPVGKSPGVTTEAMRVCPALRAQLLLFLCANGLEHRL